jgi:hypothetical protein
MKTQHNDGLEAIDLQLPVTANVDLIKKLPALLRILGAAAVLIAMYSFLAKGWQSGNDVFRYLLMLGHTAALAAIGLASGHWLKESKGARLLLTLALVSVPANFAILGAFIYSQTPGVNVGLYPHYVAWTVNSLQTALITTGAAALALIPATLIGFAVLARSISRKLSMLFLFSNVALLLPLRDPQLIALLTLALTVCAVVLSRRAAHKHSAAKTREGITALSLQLLPLAVLIGRSLWLYSVDLFLITVACFAAFFILRQISLYLAPGSRLRNISDMLSLAPAVAAAPVLGAALRDAGFIPAALMFPLATMLSATLVYDISRRSHKSAGLYRHIAVAGLTAGMIFNLLWFNGFLAAIACVLVGLSLLVSGYRLQQSGVFIGGLASLLAGIVELFHELVRHFDLGSWVGLAVLGTLSIVIASSLESQCGMLKPRLESWKGKFHQWEK